MVPKLAVCFAALLSAAAQVHGLGLGELTLESALDQPLDARIEILQAEGLRPEQITVSLASAEDFERFSIEREFFLNNLRFDVQSTDSGPMVQITSSERVREPYLSFIVDARWPSGRLLTEYTVLLDLPAFAGEAVTASVQQPISSRAAPDEENSSSQNQIPEEQSSSSSSPEANASSAVSTAEQSSAAPERLAPQNGSEGNSTARVSAGETITVDESDTLWDIALRARPDDSVSVQQTMLALQRLNPRAFIDDNINIVQRGSVLRVPDAEQIRSLSVEEAVAEVSRQNLMLNESRSRAVDAEPLAPRPGNAPSGANANQGELTVLSSESVEAAEQEASGSTDATSEMNARIAALNDRLALQAEETDRIQLQNNELNERLVLLEEQIESAREIIRLRDLELAQLQEAMAAAAEEEEAALAAAEVAAQAAAEEQASSGADGTPAQGGSAAEAADTGTIITRAPEPSLVQRVLDSITTSAWLLGAVVLLVILLLVFVLIRRNSMAITDGARADGAAADMGPEERFEDIDQNLQVGAGVAPVAAASAQAGYEVETEEDDEPETAVEDEPGSRNSSAESESSWNDESRGFSEGKTDSYESDDSDDDLDEILRFSEQLSGETSERADEGPDAGVEDEEAAESGESGDGDMLDFQESESGEEFGTGHEADQRAGALPAGVLEEADIFIAYERYDEAVSLLQNAIVAEPDRADLRLKLLEICVVRNDAVGFKLQESELRDVVDRSEAGTESAVEAKIAELRAQLREQGPDDDDILAEVPEEESPGQFDGLSPLDDMEVELDLEASSEVDDERVLSGYHEDQADVLPDELPLDDEQHDHQVNREAMAEAESADEADLETFDFDLTEEDMPDARRQADTDAGPELDPAHVVDFDLDFDLDFDTEAERDAVRPEPENASDTTAAAEPEPAAGLPSDEELESGVHDIEFNLDDFDLEAGLNGELDQMEIDENGEGAADDGDEEYDFLSDGDEVSTKLDLARAYIEMGDEEGATNILQDVVGQGVEATEAQVRDAEALLQSLKDDVKE